MKHRFFKVSRWLLVVAMGLLGFAACSKDDEGSGFETMYGVQETAYNPAR